ncbi:MAG TPA: 5'/3'-nucleotidase SurE [Ardenticatenaceae bacterium]|nr:5'/3'-nucleotidase SurE [Ardenticatenaceae bacterium]
MTSTILVTNDDGITAPGIKALWQALRAVGDVVVFAPDRNWSAAGHSKTLHKPLRADPYPVEGLRGFVSTGAPSDCVALALMGLVEPRPSLVVSGINPTANLGQDITYSGTVAAAMEAAIFGVPAIAVSLESRAGADARDRLAGDTAQYEPLAAFAARLAAHVLQVGLPRHTLLNVNAAALPPGELRGAVVTRLGTRVYRDELVRREDPRGRPYYWIGGQAPSGEVEHEGTDIWAVHHGYISVTPIHLEMTAHDLILDLRSALATISP